MALDNTVELIATLGTEPQVVTSALDLLLERKVSISQIHVLHTWLPESAISRSVDVLKAEFASQLYPNTISFAFHPISDQGKLLPDVDTPHASEAAFRALYRLIHQAKRAEHRVHLCIAGGRKNLAIYGMAAAQLLFGDRDCLWHLYSGGEFLASKRLHPQAGDDVHLLPIPVLLRDYLSPALTHLREVDDPYIALAQIQEIETGRKLEQAASFVKGALTGAERRVVALLVREGLSDTEIAMRLVLSPRTVEQHLRSAYSKAAAHWELDSINRTQLVTLLNAYFSLPGG